MKLTCEQLEKVLLSIGFHEVAHSRKYAFRFSNNSSTLVLPCNRPEDVLKPIHLEGIIQFLINERAIKAQKEFEQIVYRLFSKKIGNR